MFVATKEVYRETYHFAGVQGNVQHVFCFEEPEGKPGSFKSLLNANKGEQGRAERGASCPGARLVVHEPITSPARRRVVLRGIA